jgi:hypothetical protein
MNFALALAIGASLPNDMVLGVAMLIGFLGYGLSLVLFVFGLRHLGAARTGAYFSLARLSGPSSHSSSCRNLCHSACLGRGSSSRLDCGRT